MKIEPEVSFQNVEHSDAVEQNIRERISQLEQFHPHLITCRVVVDAPHQDKNKGNLYEIRIDMSVPGDDLAVSRHTGINHAHEDIYVALRDGFKAARRRLEDHSRRRSGRVKTHAVPPHGTVARLFPEEGYGFIRTPDGGELYFHENSLVDGSFAKLEPGQEVRYVAAEKESEKGPQATTVKRIGKHHLQG